jgi:serine/threonine protein kinase
MASPLQTIAHYRIVAKLGEGGMGQVWRAHDTRLNRDVAIKILPEVFAHDADRMARFEREAQVLASLNHPNIAAIYGTEERALVMELVEGLTLAERISQGLIPLEETLAIANQIAEALEYAHERGVVHRDLKPANIKITPEGNVKVLDFGLAKAVSNETVVDDAVSSPTLTMRATQLGVILGTAAYMAPEQAAGKAVDRRADIWSFGVVLYEMLAGKRLFTGESVSHTLAAVLKDPIEFDIPQVPMPIRRLLARCLTRNPKDRLRDIGEARIAIREYLANPSAEIELKAPVALSTPVKGSGQWISWALCALLFLCLAAVVGWNFKPSPAPLITRFPFPLGPSQNLTSLIRSALTISPDGAQIVYMANSQLYRRSMAELEGHPIVGTANERGVSIIPVFSPDSKSLAYIAGENLKRIVGTGGVPVTLCACVSGLALGLSWGDSGILLTTSPKGIQRISADGGEPETLVAPKHELIADAQWLPGGEAVLFAAADSQDGSLGLVNRWQVVVQNIKTGVRKVLVHDGYGGRYLATGHLVYFANGVLFAAPFNVRRLEITGDATSILEGVSAGPAAVQYAFSSTGTLIYLPGPLTAAGQSLLALINRKGEVETSKLPPARYGFPRISRDGRYVAYQIEDGAESSVWIWELLGATAPRRLTLPGTGNNRYPIWSDDGQRIAYQSNRAGDVGIWDQHADGTGGAEHLTTPVEGTLHRPESWSPDGQTISFSVQKQNTSEVWTYSLREKKAIVYAAEPGAELGSSMFSPDGHWVVYQSAIRGGSRIYVRSFPPSDSPYLAPQDADAHHPVWWAGGKELFYVAGAGLAGSMSFSAKPSVTFGSPVRAPRAGFIQGPPGSVRTYDVLPDGQHFIGVVRAGSLEESPKAAQIQVVLNWFDYVKQRVTR